MRRALGVVLLCVGAAGCAGPLPPTMPRIDLPQYREPFRLGYEKVWSDGSHVSVAGIATIDGRPMTDVVTADGTHYFYAPDGSYAAFEAPHDLVVVFTQPVPPLAGALRLGESVTREGHFVNGRSVYAIDVADRLVSRRPLSGPLGQFADAIEVRETTTLFTDGQAHPDSGTVWLAPGLGSLRTQHLPDGTRNEVVAYQPMAPPSSPGGAPTSAAPGASSRDAGWTARVLAGVRLTR